MSALALAPSAPLVDHMTLALALSAPLVDRMTLATLLPTESMGCPDHQVIC